MEYFSALKNNKKKKNEILSYATSVVHLEDIMLSEMNQSIKEIISENVNLCSNPSELKITDIRVANINGAPKHCPLIKVYTNQGIVGYGEVRDASSATYALMLKSRLVGENPCNVDKLFRRIKQFGGHSRQGGGVSGLEIALWDLAGKAWGVPLWQMLGECVCLCL